MELTLVTTQSLSCHDIFAFDGTQYQVIGTVGWAGDENAYACEPIDWDDEVELVEIDVEAISSFEEQ